jgi:hypothetical protein
MSDQLRLEGNWPVFMEFETMMEAMVLVIGGAIILAEESLYEAMDALSGEEVFVSREGAKAAWAGVL